jgi:cytochrome c
MDSFELNKIVGAVLGTLLLVIGSGVLADILWSPGHLEKPGYEIAVPEEAAGGGAQQPAEAAEPIAVRLAAADTGKGQGAAKKCAACHTFEKGGANKVGPNLYDVIERPVASASGFAYSQAMQQKKQAGDAWTYETLDTFLENPKGAVPGTNMAFAGIKRAGERADVIAYLRSLSDSPKPLPASTGAPGRPIKLAQAD